MLNLITSSQPPVASSGETQPSSSASGETQQEGSAAEEPVRVPSANVTVVDPREEGKLAEEIQKNLIQELEKEQTEEQAEQPGEQEEQSEEQPQEQTEKQTQEQPEQSEEQPKIKDDTSTGKQRAGHCTERTGTTGRAEAGRWSKLPGRKYHGGDSYSGTDP